MKNVISSIMVAIMLLTLCVPAFAFDAPPPGSMTPDPTQPSVQQPSAPAAEQPSVQQPNGSSQTSTEPEKVTKFVMTPDKVTTGFITNDDQLVYGLSFNIRVEYQGYQYVRVIGIPSNIDDWKIRHHGTYVSEQAVIDIENMVRAGAPVTTPTPEKVVTFIKTPDEVATGFITHEDQEINGLSFNIRVGWKDFQYVRVAGPVASVEDWRVRHHGVYVTEQDVRDAENALRFDQGLPPLPRIDATPPTETPVVTPTPIVTTTPVVSPTPIVTPITPIPTPTATPVATPTTTPEVSPTPEVTSTPTEEIDVTPEPPKFIAETPVLSAEADKKGITLSWEMSRTSGVIYQIYRKSDTVGYEPITDFPVADLSYIDYKVLPNIQYTYKCVISYPNGKFSNDSNEVTTGLTSKKLISLQIGKAAIKVNGNNKNIDTTGTAPVVIEGRTLLPIRAIVESLGGVVEWDGATQQVTITLNDKTIALYIDKNNAMVNGESKQLDVAPMIKNNRTFVPLRFVAESLGCEVRWEGFTQTVTIVQ